MGRHRTKHRAPRGPSRVLARSWYAVLDIEPTATPEEVKAAYRRALDRSTSSDPSIEIEDDARESMRREIESAFRVLSDPDQRARFDASLAKGSGGPSTGEASGNGRSPRREARRGAAKPAQAGSAQASAGDLSAAKEAPRMSPSGSTTPRVALRFLPPLHEGEFHAAPHEPAAGTSSVGSTSPPGNLEEGQECDAPVSELPRHLSILPQETTPLALPSLDEIDGEVVRRLREERGLSLEVLAAHTHIGKTYLQAIEDNAVDELPARVYLRGFLTQVARVLRVDRRLLADGYLRFVERRRSSPSP